MELAKTLALGVAFVLAGAVAISIVRAISRLFRATVNRLER